MPACYGPPAETIADLREALVRLHGLLLRQGMHALANRLLQDEQRLGRGDFSAIESIVAEATGGMGSLNDLAVFRERIDELRTLAQTARSAPWSSRT